MGCGSSAQQVAPYPAENRQNEPMPIGINQLISRKDFIEVERIGDQYFKDKKYLEAIAIYKKAIEGGYKVDYQIEGLGNFDFETYNYEWWTYKWYDEQRTSGKFKGSIFDALALCICKIKESHQAEMEQNMMWYEDMLSENPTYQLYMGYAHVLYNRYLYDRALKAYNKVIEMRPTLINAYVAIMFLHEFKRVEKQKAIVYANKVLAMDPNNMQAYFVLGKNQQNVDARIKKLTESAEKFPYYIRLVNQVGLSHGAKKDHKSAIFWYKKCLSLAPNDYAQGYNNVAYRTQMLEDFPQALKYYYKAVEIDPKYKMAFANAIKLFEKMNWTDEDIIKQIDNYPKIDRFNFYYYLGLAYYDRNDGKRAAITWYKRAEKLDSNSFNLYNSLGLAYDSIQEYDQAEQYYLKSMKISPKYKFPPYNMGLLFKHKGDIEKAIQWYHKAIQNDPEYHPPYNNLANIYRDRQQYQKAIELYKKATEIHSTYTLAFCNMGLCLLKQYRYQDAFAAFSRAKELLPTDNNGLSEENKNFLRENLAKLDKEGDVWRKTGSIGPQQKKQLEQLIKSFEANFKILYSGESSFRRSDQIVLKPAIIQIIKLVFQDQFELKRIDQIFNLIKHVFHDDEEYFHIVPQLFIQYFYKNSFTKNRPILEVESELSSIIKSISSKEAALLGPADASSSTSSVTFNLKYFNPPKDTKVNLFKDTAFFSSYQALYSEIDKVNKQAEKFLPQFVQFVQAVRKRSNGIPYGVNMKMPKRADQQFKVILRILQKMFKKQINVERVKSIISKIDKKLRTSGQKVTLMSIVHQIMDVWTKEITLILQQREKNKLETTCTISDLLRGKLMFNTVEDVAKAVDACDKMCHLKGYNILEVDNRLSKPQTQDVVLKIQVGDAVCQFQLALKQDESKYHFIHSIYEIERSPLGCIFGSYLFMSKGFNYPLLANCKDIQERVDGKDKEVEEAAKYIVEALEQK